MRLLTCVSVVACVAHKLRPCPSYSRCGDHINLGLWRSSYKGGGVHDQAGGLAIEVEASVLRPDGGTSWRCNPT